MKITDDEREAAYELKWMIDEILRERERAVLFREVFVQQLAKGHGHMLAVQAARDAIAAMESAFAPICEACREENAVTQQKAN
jgi:hypothetical protein